MSIIIINTPNEIKFPEDLDIKDFGLELVNHRGWLHQISFRKNNGSARQHVINAGYSFSHGCREKGKQYSIWQKLYSLEVGSYPGEMK